LRVRAVLAEASRADVEVVLEILHGLPLVLTKAGSYMRETNASASTYAKHYSQTWERLMKSEVRWRPKRFDRTGRCSGRARRLLGF
jgi:hypothetical protein